MADEKKEPEKNKLEKREDVNAPFDNMPEPVRAMFSAFSARVPVFPPFMGKINEEHITKVLDYSERKDERDFRDIQEERKYEFWKLVIICVVSVSLFVFLTIYLVDKDKDLYKDIVKVAVGLMSGLAAGYGIGIRKGQKEDD